MRVKLPTGQYGNFPDSMSHEEIESVLQNHFSSPQTQTMQSQSQQPQDNYRSELAGFYPLEMAKNLGAGIGNTMRNVGANIGNMVPNNPVFNSFAPISGARKMESLGRALSEKLTPPNQNLSDEAVQFAGEQIPLIAGGELAALGKAPAFANELAGEGIHGLGGQLARYLGIVGKNAAFGAGANALTGDSNDSLATRLTEGAIGGGAGGAVHPVFAGKLKPSNLFRGNLSEEELLKNLEAAKGTTTGLGDVIGSPTLKRTLENVNTIAPFTSAYGVMQNTGKQIVQKGQDLLGQLSNGQDTNDLKRNLVSGLKETQSDAQVEKRRAFDSLNGEADEAGIHVKRGNFSNAAQQELDDIKKSPELEREISPSVISDLESYSANKEGNNFKLSNIFKGKIGDKANEFYINDKTHEYGIYKRLKDALQKDIDDEISSKGNSAFKQKYDNTNKWYIENIAPLEDPDITKFTRKGGDSDLIMSHFIRTGGTNDRANLLQKLMSKLPDETKSLVGHGYLSSAVKNGKVNPNKLDQLYGKLGDRQKDILFGNGEDRKAIENYVHLVKMNSEPLSVMANPKNGQRLKDVTGIGTFLTALWTGHPELAAGVAISPLAERLATRYLTNEGVRENLVRSMLSKRPPINTTPMHALSQALANHLLQGDQQNGT